MQSEPNTSESPFRIDVAERVKRLPPYLFGKINDLKYRKRRAGVDVIDLRFPTSRTNAGSDAVHPDPDYSAAYVVLSNNIAHDNTQNGIYGEMWASALIASTGSAAFGARRSTVSESQC